MTKNITLLGASYTDVPGVELPQTGGGTAYFADTSDADAVANDIDTGKTAYVNGVKVTGIRSSGGNVDGILKGDGAGNISAAVPNVDYLTPFTSSASGAIAAFYRFTDGIPVSSCIADITPVQSGGGDPSPSNVRTIGGFDTVDICHASRNLLVDNRSYPHTAGSIQITRNAADGGYVVNGSKGSSAAVVIFNFAYQNGTTTATQCDYKKWLPNGQYKMSITANGLPSGASVTLQAFYNTKFNDVSTADLFASVSTGSTGPTTITVSDAYPFVWFRLLFSSGAYTFDNVKLYPMIYRADETDTSWDAPRASKAISLGRTVYGGTLDVTTGLLTVTHSIATFNGSESWGGPDVDGNIYVALSVAGKMTDRASGELTSQLKFNLLCSGGKTVGEGFVSSGGYLNCKPPDISTVAGWKTLLGTTNLQVCYPLDTPTTYQLTPTQVASLLGENNIWATSGNVHVEFEDDIKNYIDTVVLGAMGGSY